MSTTPPDQPTFSHSGRRYLLGYTSTEYGIWDRQAPGPPVRRFAKSEAGWSEAWNAYQGLESPPAAAPASQVARPTPAASASPAPAAVSSAPASAPTTPIPRPSALPAVRITGRLVSQVLKVSAWAVLALFVILGIAVLVDGGGFVSVMQGLADIALGTALWGVCWTLSDVAERNR